MYKVLSVGIVWEHDIRVLKKQYELFKRYMKEDFEFICAIGIGCTDSKRLVSEIDKAFEGSIQVIETPQQTHLDPSWRGSVVLQNALNLIPPCKLFIVHADLFPISHFSLNEWFSGYDIGGWKQIRRLYNLEYVWENMLYLDTTEISIEEVDFGCVNGGDTSSALSKILPKYKVKYFEDFVPPYGLYTDLVDDGGYSHRMMGVYLNNDDGCFEKLPLDKNTIETLKNISRIKSHQVPFHAPEFYMGCLYHYRSGAGWHTGGAERVHIDKIREACYDEITKL
jgi:hypothetical protein